MLGSGWQPELKTCLPVLTLVSSHLSHSRITQVIKCELFDEAVDRAVKRYPLMLLTTPTQAAAGYR
jgi:hypothetical protein